ncbi:MAG: hypothetical protein ACI9VT_000175 [Psychroserpens sp.]|jgi:hypothetical protein
MAVEYFQKDRLLPAFDAINQALKLNLNNVNLLFSKLKILIKIKQEEQETPDHLVLVEEMLAVLSTLTIEGKSLTTFDELTLKWKN